MPKTFTKEEKQKYFQGLRDQWRKAKEYSENPDVKNKYELLVKQSPNKEISLTSFAFILMGMEKFGLDGLPYLDCKTFSGWKDSGFKVKKGETSKLKGIVWMSFKDKEDKEDPTAPIYPKLYHLFYRNQIEALTK